eukprot:TRINITY_DN562_c0_g2_i17.p2 TRINITY_DN562_c0_g2~~TRINITY_DN562_c0_g2_i17.p2  ORF type:complete len:120 (+),score=35.09 TRINITY_DN562_c0_g2_i17:418-777(+)
MTYLECFCNCLGSFITSSSPYSALIPLLEKQHFLLTIQSKQLIELHPPFFLSRLKAEHHLKGNKIGIEGTKAIAEALKLNYSIISIALAKNKIGPEGAKYVAEALKVNCSITSIALDGI